jgi:hypothetical protein
LACNKIGDAIPNLGFFLLIVLEEIIDLPLHVAKLALVDGSVHHLRKRRLGSKS